MMKKAISKFFVFAVFAILFLSTTNNVYAADASKVFDIDNDGNYYLRNVVFTAGSLYVSSYDDGKIQLWPVPLQSVQCTGCSTYLHRNVDNTCEISFSNGGSVRYKGSPFINLLKEQPQITSSCVTHLSINGVLMNTDLASAIETTRRSITYNTYSLGTPVKIKGIKYTYPEETLYCSRCQSYTKVFDYSYVDERSNNVTVYPAATILKSTTSTIDVEVGINIRDTSKRLTIKDCKSTQSIHPSGEVIIDGGSYSGSPAVTGYPTLGLHTITISSA